MFIFLYIFIKKTVLTRGEACRIRAFLIYIFIRKQFRRRGGACKTRDFFLILIFFIYL